MTVDHTEVRTKRDSGMRETEEMHRVVVRRGDTPDRAPHPSRAALRPAGSAAARPGRPVPVIA